MTSSEYSEIDLTEEWVRVLSDRTPPDVFHLLGEAAHAAHEGCPEISPDQAMRVAWEVWQKLSDSPDSALLGITAMVAARAVDDAMVRHQETVSELRTKHLEEGAQRIEERARQDKEALEKYNSFDSGDAEIFHDRLDMANLVRGRQQP